MDSHIRDATLLTDVAWRKSTHSGQGGGQCVEVGAVPDLTDVVWRKSTRSGPNGGSCVEVGALPEQSVTAVRDSKDPGGPALLFGSAEWAVFVRSLR
ncbi:DUF397 domain-containing protein [Haloactinomyces albus]|uniref:DUF397 domain-containing protein n=1 Tax=Haloactinomyces albus TaxID=1352928 RepID=A0AAE3ZE53_9ACTN|nr:DUF397 domain-containing protein [Haloactinomyces albus]MDR7303261.1 hypothetical protein [Haloactinomyces albus]